MAAPASRPISNIAVAFAAQSASVEIPKPREGGLLHPLASLSPPVSKNNNNNTTTAAANAANAALLLTPPNSISPTLSPHSGRPDRLSTSTQLDSDIDLQDAVEHAAAQDQPTALSSAALSGLEAAGAITPSMLAKNHLPDILLAHGPMAIRHVLGHLTHTVPGFSGIQPTKARRIVVSALESRTGGGPNGEVEFEKVGWGRWDAQVRGQPPRDGRTVYHGSVPILSRSSGRAGMSPPASVPESYAMSSMDGLQIPKIHRHRGHDTQSGSWTNNSLLSSHDEDIMMDDMNMPEHEADKMSLDEDDEDDSGSSSAAGDDEVPVLEDDLDDATDEEDWAAIGPEALRRGSMPHNGYNRSAPRTSNYLSRSSTARLRTGGAAGASSHASAAVPPRSTTSSSSHHLHQKYTQHRRPSAGRNVSAGYPLTTPTSASVPQPITNNKNPNLDMYGVMNTHDSQEREAVEALLRMGSM